MLQKITTKVKCDVRDCRNDAVYCFQVKGRGGLCRLCTSCLAKLYDEGRAQFVPKSPANAIKKRLERSADEK